MNKTDLELFMQK